MVKRSGKDSWMTGFWECPGGKVEAQQNLSEALEREVLEETGVLVVPTHRVAYYEGTLATSPKYKGFTCLSLIGISTTDKSKVKLSSEHDQYGWFSYADALKLESTPQVQKALKVLEKEIKQIIRAQKRLN